MVGRDRDLDARDRILDATFRLLSAPDRTDVSVVDIARAACVGKQTIYRWWPTREDLTVDALLQASLDATPFPDTGDTRADLTTHLESVADLFASRTGELVKQVVAGALVDPRAAGTFVRRFWQPRRELSTACLARGVADGQVRSGLDAETVLDALYGPLWVCLLLGHRPIERSIAAATIALVWPGVVVTGRAPGAGGRRPRA